MSDVEAFETGAAAAETYYVRPSQRGSQRLQIVFVVLVFIAILLIVCIAWILHAEDRGFQSVSVDAEAPFFDVMIMIYMTGGLEDAKRLKSASSSWLQRPQVDGLTFGFVCLICADDPNSLNLFGEAHVVILPCKHGYSPLVTKGIEGYHYISKNFRFKYVIKADIDTVLPLDCIVRVLRSVDDRACPSFGMGLWYPGNYSHVYKRGDFPYGLKFSNQAYRSDTGHDVYPPYPSGWAIIWTSDVARFLGMYGQDDAPRWRRTWTIDDAAIGTFILGLDICRLPLPCTVASDVSSEEMHQIDAALGDESDLLIDPGVDTSTKAVAGFRGPYADDVPGVGDLGNLHAKSLGNCAARCQALDRCTSFEYSRKTGMNEQVHNCQLASSAVRSGLVYLDFRLYIRLAVDGIA